MNETGKFRPDIEEKKLQLSPQEILQQAAKDLERVKATEKLFSNIAEAASIANDIQFISNAMKKPELFGKSDDIRENVVHFLGELNKYVGELNDPHKSNTPSEQEELVGQIKFSINRVIYHLGLLDIEREVQ